VPLSTYPVLLPPGSPAPARLLDSATVRRLLWAVAAVLWTVMVAIQLRRASPHGWLDLRVYRDSVHQFLAGRPLYDIHVTEVHLPFTYPPVAIYLLAPLAWLPFPLAAGGLLVANGLLLLATCWACLRTVSGGRPVMAAAAALAGAALFLEPVWSALNFGQIDMLLMASVVLDVLVVPTRFRGILTGVLAAVKLTPLVFLLLFALRRDWGAVRRLLAAFAALTAIAFVVLPHESTFYWLHAVRDPRRIGPPVYVGNVSTYGAALRVLGDNGPAHLMWLAVSGVVLVATLVVVRRSVVLGHRVAPLALVALAGLLCSPISWDHHWVWMVVLAVAAVELWTWSRAAAWLAVVLVLATAVLQPKRIEVGQKSGAWPGYQRFLVSNVWLLLAYALLAVLLVATVRARPEAAGTVEPASEPGRQRA
jgi:alpha-1,2-mannosyltransferase